MKVLLLDCETAPTIAYVWGLFNQNIHISHIEEPGYVLCWSAKWLGKNNVEFASIHEDGKEAMLKKIYDLLDEADAVVHFNGSKFDIPQLNREFLLMGWGPPSPFKEVDLLKVVRRRFKFASNKLDYVCQALGLGSKIKNKGLSLWKECMVGNERAWKMMKRYNVRDTKLLEPLYKKLLPWIKNHPNFALFNEDERPQCTNCGSHQVQSRGVETTKTLTYRRWQCQSCGTWMRSNKAERPSKEVLVGI